VTGAPGFADAVVVAAGASRRMGGADKMGALLGGRPLLAWTLEAIAAASSVRRIVVVTAPERVADLAAASWLRDLAAAVIPGGARRQESVAAGVAEVDAEVVLVHDGARPLVSPALVDRVALAARAFGAAIPVRAVAETVKRVEDGLVVGTVSRAGLATAQTPQGIRRDLLLGALAAHPATSGDEYTDEAALLEAAGVPVMTVEGDADNLKVTESADLVRAEAILAGRQGLPRVGHGRDSHPFGPGDGLALGGITIAEAPRLHGHSDGDVALHAVADALLGASGSGDLGRLFPAGDAATEGIASSRLLTDVVARLAEAGWRPRQVDLLIVAARPRLGGARLEAMRDAIAGLVGLTRDAVSVRASSGNLDGPEGTGRSISATALVTVMRR
jgi:2-C-methyl-D-erythritol 4-phosphate cytidylyltransferase/2-C-methyl-D-erythritol 2,4-cyclodiphosphate synthase